MVRVEAAAFRVGSEEKENGQTHETALDCTKMEACVGSGAVR